MRIPKYRAWDKGRKEYLSSGQILISIESGKRPEKSNIYLDILKDANKYNDRFIIEQYTGLYDKNGKEIYEGDILKRTSTIKQWERELFDEIIGKVTIKIGMTYLVGKRKHGYLDEELKISNYKALLLSPDLFEVIGDAHNNPELLESEE